MKHKTSKIPLDLMSHVACTINAAKEVIGIQVNVQNFSEGFYVQSQSYFQRTSLRRIPWAPDESTLLCGKLLVIIKDLLGIICLQLVLGFLT